MSDEDDIYEDDEFDIDESIELEGDDQLGNAEKVDPKKLDARRRLEALLEQKRLEKELDDFGS